jgi:hypothetical protein
MKTVNRFVLLLLSCLGCAATESKRPNILLILSAMHALEQDIAK